MPPAAPQLFLVASVSLLLALLSTPVVARLAVRWGYLDRPDGRRKLHKHPVPTVGGVAVIVAFAAAAAFLELAAARHGAAESWSATWQPLVVSALLLMLLGLIDDTRGLRPVTKVLVQTVVGVYLFSCGFRIERLPWGGHGDLGAFALPLTIVWLVGMSNALNLIEGLDGLAAGLSLVSTLGLLGAALFAGRLDVALVAAALAGALAGFLPYNFNPARIFLGDCGSLPVGLILAAIAVRGTLKAPAAILISVPLLAFALPILDVGLAVLRRFVRRRPVLVGDHDHIHHRLLDMGLTPRRVVLILYGVATLFTTLALATVIGPSHLTWAAAAVVLVVITVGVRALGYWEVTEIQRTLVRRLVSGLRASGDAALRGLEHEIGRAASFADAWDRVCETAWTLGFTELRLTPRAAFAASCPRWHRFVHRPDLCLAALHGEVHAITTATWSIEVVALDTIVAEVVGRRPLEAPDFDPRRFSAIVQGLVAREVSRAVELAKAVPRNVDSLTAAQIEWAAAAASAEALGPAESAVLAAGPTGAMVSSDPPVVRPDGVAVERRRFARSRPASET